MVRVPVRHAAVGLAWLAACAGSADAAGPSGPLSTTWFVQAGDGPKSRTLALTFGAVHDTGWRWQVGSGELVLLLEGSAGHWRNREPTQAGDPPSGARRFRQVGLTPTLRYAGNPERGWFAEGGIGINYITPTFAYDTKRFSTRLNFGDHVAVGWRDPTGFVTEAALRFQHYSNAGVREPNPGVEFIQLRLSRSF